MGHLPACKYCFCKEIQNFLNVSFIFCQHFLVGRRGLMILYNWSCVADKILTWLYNGMLYRVIWLFGRWSSSWRKIPGSELMEFCYGFIRAFLMLKAHCLSLFIQCSQALFFTDFLLSHKHNDQSSLFLWVVCDFMWFVPHHLLSTIQGILPRE